MRVLFRVGDRAEGESVVEADDQEDQSDDSEAADDLPDEDV